MNKHPERLRIALQRKGRLSQESIALLKGCGIRLPVTNRLLCHSPNHPVDALLVRDDDIPHLVMDGVCDLGIVGTNVLEEAALRRGRNGDEAGYVTIEKLGFGGCRLSIAVPEELPYQRPQDLEGLRIATTYPQLLRRYAQAEGVEIDITVLSGSVEVAPRAGIADAVCDLVSTGATLEANGLREVEQIFRSQAVLIQSRKPLAQEKAHVLDLLLRRTRGVLSAVESKYIMLHAPQDRLAEVTALLPGTDAPTILPLAGNADTVAVHAVCREKVFWETLEQLRSLGASSILVVPIEKMLA